MLLVSSAERTHERLLIRLRATNGDVVDVRLARTGEPVALLAPQDTELRLDILSLDGQSLPMIGLPVTAGASVRIHLGGP